MQRTTLVFRLQLHCTSPHFSSRRNVEKKINGYPSSLCHSRFFRFLSYLTSTVSLPVEEPMPTQTLVSAPPFWLAICFFTSHLSRLEVLLNSITWTQLQLPDWCFLIPSHHHNGFFSLFFKSWFHDKHCFCFSSTVSFTPLVQPF